MTPAELAAVRAHVGSSFSTVEIGRVFDREGSVEAAALSILTIRLADLLLDGPLKLDVKDDVTEDWTGNVKALGDKIATLDAMVAGGSGEVTIQYLSRPDSLR